MTDKKSTKRESEMCLGKLRQLNSDKDKYILYDNGENYTQSGTSKPTLDSLRSEHGLFMFRYELCQIGNIRKMKVLLPHLYKVPKENNIDNYM